MEELLKTDIPLVGECNFNSRENTPLRYTKKGALCKNNKQVIDSTEQNPSSPHDKHSNQHHSAGAKFVNQIAFNRAEYPPFYSGER